MKPTCRDVCDQSTALLEGATCGLDREALLKHLALCPPCGEYLRQMGLTIEALRRLPEACGAQARAELLKRYEAWLDERRGG